MAHILSRVSPSVQTETEIDDLIAEAVAYEEYLWRASQNDSWHDQDAVKDCGDCDADCSLDFEDEHQAEVERWFRTRGLRADHEEQNGDFDQPWYGRLGLSHGYVAEI